VARRDLACVKKKATAEKRTLVCIDEAAFYLLPGVVRTWALCGQPPILTLPLTREHLSVISAITPQGKLYLHLKEGAMDGGDVVHFLCHLLRQIPGKLLILWDGASIHRGQRVRNLLATDRAGDLWLERFPPYAPELNPDEGIWHYLKNVELRNLCLDTVRQLRTAIHQAANRMRKKTRIITACFNKAGLYL
jgi:transposase